MPNNSPAGSYFFDDTFQVDTYYRHVRDNQPAGRAFIDLMDWPTGCATRIFKDSSLTRIAGQTQAATARPISIDIDDLSTRPVPALRVMFVIA
jgi:hypothetical protein